MLLLWLPLLPTQDLGTQHPVVAISLQTLGHVLRTRQQLPQALEAAQRCEALRVPQGQGPLLASAQHLQVRQLGAMMAMLV